MGHFYARILNQETEVYHLGENTGLTSPFQQLTGRQQLLNSKITFSASIQERVSSKLMKSDFWVHCPFNGSIFNTNNTCRRLGAGKKTEERAPSSSSALLVVIPAQYNNTIHLQLNLLWPLCERLQPEVPMFIFYVCELALAGRWAKRLALATSLHADLKMKAQRLQFMCHPRCKNKKKISE